MKSSKQKVNQLSTILQKLHIKQPLYNNLMSILQYKSISKIKDIEKIRRLHTDKPQTIYFNCLHTTYLSSVYKEAAMAKLIQLLGHNVVMLMCGQSLNMCTGMFNCDVPYNKRMCKNCMWHGTHLFDALDLPYKYYSEYLPIDEIIKEYIELAKKDGQLFGVNVKYHALTSAQRYSKGGKINDDIYAKRFEDAVKTVLVAREIFVREHPTKIVTSHSCYAEWGSFSDLFKEVGVPVFTWYTGYNPKTLVFDLTEIDKNFQRYLHSRKQKKLTSGELTELKFYLKMRRIGKDDTKLYNFNSKSGVSREFKEPAYLMFPNLAWDVDPTCAGDFFSNTFDWIDKTINIFKKRKEKLIIRAHPAEQVYKSKVTTMKHIDDAFGSLPNNIKVIDSTEPINSYSLFDNAKVGVISNGTIGLEMTMNDIPVMVVGNAHYKGKGFTYDIESQAEYEKSFDLDLREVPNKSMRDLYCYYYFIKSFIPFPILRHRNFMDIGWNASSYLNLYNDKYLMHIVNCILFDKIFQRW